MITYKRLVAFFGWMLVINIGLLILTFLGLTALRGVLYPIHSAIFAVNVDDLARIYLEFIAEYKSLIIVFNLVPYIALKIIGLSKDRLSS
jgi:hypothetical protein